MNKINETNAIKQSKPKYPILQLNRINYVKVGGQVLDTTSDKLDKFIACHLKKC